MSFQYYKSKTLNTPIIEGSAPLHAWAYLKTNIQNINDGGIALRLQFAEQGAIKSVHYISGSYESPNMAIKNQILAIVNHTQGPSAIFDLTTQEDFETALGEFETFYHSI